VYRQHTAAYNRLSGENAGLGDETTVIASQLEKAVVM